MKLRKIFKWLGILFLLCLVGLGVLYYLVQSGKVSLFALSSMMSAQGDIVIVNAGTETLSVKLAPTDPDAEGGTQSTELEPMDTGGFGSVLKGEYTLTFSPGGECNLSIGRGDDYTFIAVPKGIAIAKDGFKATSANDLKIATSPLCK